MDFFVRILFLRAICVLLFLYRNNLDINSIFDENLTVKEEVEEEAIKSINWCRENIKLSIPKLTNLPKEELDEKRLEELTNTFPDWYLNTLEEIRRGK